MISDSNNSKASLSSLPLEVLIHFNGHFSTLFFLATVCLYIYKCKKNCILYVMMNHDCFCCGHDISVTLRSCPILLPRRNISMGFGINIRLCYSRVHETLFRYAKCKSNLHEYSLSFVCVCFANFIISLCHHLDVTASKGNKTSKLGPLAVALFFTIPIIVLHAYYIELQLYV